MNEASDAPKNLWTRNFSLVTTATVLTAIGGEAMTLPISLYVFDQTQSTLLSSLIHVFGVLPDILLPILVAPMIDRSSKKKWILTLDILMGLLFLVIGLWVATHDFSFDIYAMGTLLVGAISVCYRIATSAWMPDLIPLGFEQKGYAVFGIIYPLVIIAMAPVSTYMYEQLSMSSIFLIVAGLTFASVLIESLIIEELNIKTSGYTFRRYFLDIVEGFQFIRKERGIRNIYSYMSVSGGAGSGVQLMAQTFYQTQPWLSVVMLGYLKSAEMIGRGLAGFLQYKWEVPVKKRYLLTKLVYAAYSISDSILLLLPYPLMVLNRFIVGLLGSTTATIRHTAVQSYLPAEMRARVNGLFDVVFSLGTIAFQLLAGVLGGYLPYPTVALILSCITLTAMYFLIYRPGEANRRIYESVRVESPAAAVDAALHLD